MWNLKQQQQQQQKKKTKLIERDKICSPQRSGLEVLGKEELKEGDPPGKGDLHQRYKLPIYKTLEM